jgi:hypothetical protein
VARRHRRRRSKSTSSRTRWRTSAARPPRPMPPTLSAGPHGVNPDASLFPQGPAAPASAAPDTRPAGPRACACPPARPDSAAPPPSATAAAQPRRTPARSRCRPGRTAGKSAPAAGTRHTRTSAPSPPRGSPSSRNWRLRADRCDAPDAAPATSACRSGLGGGRMREVAAKLFITHPRFSPPRHAPIWPDLARARELQICPPDARRVHAPAALRLGQDRIPAGTRDRSQTASASSRIFRPAMLSSCRGGSVSR